MHLAVSGQRHYELQSQSAVHKHKFISDDIWNGLLRQMPCTPLTILHHDVFSLRNRLIVLMESINYGRPTTEYLVSEFRILVDASPLSAFRVIFFRYTHFRAILSPCNASINHIFHLKWSNWIQKRNSLRRRVKRARNSHYTIVGCQKQRVHVLECTCTFVPAFSVPSYKNKTLTQTDHWTMETVNNSPAFTLHEQTVPMPCNRECWLFLDEIKFFGHRGRNIAIWDWRLAAPSWCTKRFTEHERHHAIVR